MSPKQILVFDYDAATIELIDELFSAEGYGIMQCAALSLEYVKRARPDLLVLELRPANADNVVLFIDKLRHTPQTRQLPVLVASTDKRLLNMLAAPLRHFDCCILAKPFDLESLKSTVFHTLFNSPGASTVTPRVRRHVAC